MLSHLICAGLSLVAPLQDPAPSPSGFRPLGFDAALIQAQALSVPLLVDFYDPASDEWTVMKRVTWGDPVTLRWLEARVVAVQFEFSREAELAQRLGVTSPATCVFLTPEGLEIDRLRGFVDARTFMTEGQGIVNCMKHVGPARLALDADRLNPVARVDLGLAYLSCRRLARALEEVLWAWDHGYERVDFREARLSELPLVIKRVLAAYPGGRQAVIERRDQLQKRLLAFEEGADSVRLAREVSALNTGLFAEKKQLELFNDLRARPKVPREVLEALYCRMLVDMLIRDKRWSELLDGRGDVLLWLDSEYLTLREVAAAVERGEQGLGISADALSIRRNGALHLAGGYVEALFSTGKAREASEAIDLVLLHDARAQAHHTLLRACLGARRIDEARALLARAERRGFAEDELEPLRRSLASAAGQSAK